METTAPYRSLRPGEMLNWYRIERILGHGGFGVIYLATDTNLQHQVAIKEYRLLVPASSDDTESVTEELRERASQGMQRFIVEARNLVRFKHPNIVRVMSVFELNDTAYMVMEYEAGQDLREYLKIPKNASEAALKHLLVPISQGLSEVHKHGYIHRDIKPANILVRTDGTPVLLDFGSARPALPVGSDTMTALVSAGYSSLEQYSGGSEREQGPWTDIYSLGAVLYFAISGMDPLDCAKRGTALLNGGKDPLVPARMIGHERYSSAFLRAIDWALEIRIADRPQSLSEWMRVLLGIDTREEPTQRSDMAAQTVRTGTGAKAEPPIGLSMRDHSVSRRATTTRTRRRGRRRGWRRHARALWVMLPVAALIAIMAGWLESGPNDRQVTATPPDGQLRLLDEQVTAARMAAEKADAEKAALLARENAEAAESAKAAAREQAEAAAAARVQAAAEEQARLAAQEAERKARLRARRIQLATALEQASMLLDQGLLDEAQASLDEAASIDRDDASLKALRSRWLAALIDSRTPVSDDEFDRVIEQFDTLRRALESNDVTIMERLTEPSDQNALFRQLMSRFARLDIGIDRIRVRNVDKSITARLRIETMIRSNGDRAIPSPAYRDRTISSRRTEGQWSLIQW